MFSSRTDTIRNAAKLLTASIAFGTSPGLKTGTSLYDAAKKLLKHPPDRFARMTDQMADLARAIFDGFSHDLPTDAEILFAQMVQKSLPDVDMITTHSMDPDRIAEAMLAKLTEGEQTTQPMQQLFRDIVTPILKKTCADKGIAEELTPAFMAQMLARSDEQTRLARQILKNTEDASEAQLREAAGFFDDAPGPDATNFQLMRFLNDKAEDLAKLESEIKALQGLPKQLQALHKAALNALRNLDFPETRRLIRKAKQIHHTENLRPSLEYNAQFSETEAKVALFEGDTDEAYRIFNETAQSFRILDVLEMAQFRDRYFHILYSHGMRFGGSGIQRAIDIQRPTLVALEETVQPQHWCRVATNLAAALSDLGMRTEGETGLERLGEAADLHLQVLGSRTRDINPIGWAVSNLSLGNTFQMLAARLSGPGSVENYEAANRAYDLALSVFSQTEHPSDWAVTVQNRATVLLRLASLSDRDLSLQLLEAATSDLQQTAEYFETSDKSLEWSGVLLNLGNIDIERGIRTAGVEGIKLLDHAVSQFEQAATIRTEKEHPLDWADLKFNTARAQQYLSLHKAAQDPKPSLRLALENVEKALRVFEKTKTSFNHANASKLRAQIMLSLGMVPDQSSPAPDD